MGIRTVFAKIRLAAAVFAAACGLCGCVSYGTSIDTTLELKDDLSGVRVMEVSFEDRTFTRNFSGSLEDLDRVIRENCPEELTWSREAKDGREYYHVELPFDSPFDYRIKVMVLTGRSVDLTIQAADSVWEKGIAVNEGFTSSDLLGWLTDALVAEGMVSEDLADRVFGMEGGVLIYDGEHYSGGMPIRVDEMTSAPPEKLLVRTAMKGADRYDRSFSVCVPHTSMQANGEEIKAWLNGLVPADAASAWEVYENGEMLTVTKEDMDLSELNAFGRAFLNAEDSGARVTDAAPGTQIFSFAGNWEEEMDLSAFCSGESGTIDVAYYVKPEDGAELAGITVGEEAAAGGESTASGGESTSDGQQSTGGYPVTGGVADADGYLLLYSGKADRLDVDFGFAKVYRIRHTDIDTTVDGTGKLDRTVTLTFEQTPETAQREQMISRLTERGEAVSAEEAGTDVSPVGIDAGVSEDGFSVTIRASGDAAAVASAYSGIFDGKTEIDWETSGGLLSLRKSFSYRETADYGEFLSDVTADHGITYTLEFTGTGCAPAQTDQKAQAALEAAGLSRTADGKTVIYETDGTSYTVTEAGSGIYLPGIVFWVVIVLLAVIATAAIVRFAVMRQGKEKADRAQPQDRTLPRDMRRRAEEKELRRAVQAAERAEAEAAEAARQLAGSGMDLSSPEDGAERRKDGDQ